MWMGGLVCEMNVCIVIKKKKPNQKTPSIPHLQVSNIKT